MLKAILTGTSLSILSQVISDKNFAHPTAQLLPLLKYSSILLVSCFSSDRTSLSQLSKRAQVLLAVNSVIDVVAYATVSLGFVACGASLSVLIFSAASQSATVLLSRVLLGTRLSPQQLAAVILVNLGVCMRTLLPLFIGPGTGQGARSSGMSGKEAWGAAAIIFASLGYAVLGVLFKTLQQEARPPSYTLYMRTTSSFGLAAMSTYALLYVYPRRQQLLLQPFGASGMPLGGVGALCVLFGIVYNLHAYVQVQMLKNEGTIATGLVNAIRSAVVVLVSAAVFCSAEKPTECLTPSSFLGAGLVTLGTILWVRAKPPTALAKPEGAVGGELLPLESAGAAKDTKKIT